MLKVIVIFVLACLNIGMYLWFVRPVQLTMSKTYVLIGSLIYLVIGSAFLIYGDVYSDLIKVSLYLLVANVLVFVLLQVIMPAVQTSNAVPGIFVSRFFQYLLMPIVTLMVTTWQYIYLFDTPQ